MRLASRVRAMFCILAIALTGIPACSEAPDCHREDVFCAALVTDTNGLKDFALNQNTGEGLEQSQAAGLVDQVAYIESVNPKDYEKNIAFFAESGYDVIVTAGFGLRDATLRSATLYPDPVFIGMNQPDEDSAPNYLPVTFPEDQMGFLAGVSAARLTQSKIVGAVCETSSIDAMWRYCEGFRSGAAYADESVKVFVVYRDDGSRDKLFIDPEWGYETAWSIAREEADVIFAAGGETAVGALRAAKDAKIHAIGVERDHRAALGEEGSGMAASIMGDASSTVQTLIGSIKTGKFPESPPGPIEFVPAAEAISDSLFLEINEILSGFADGSIKTNVTFEK